MNHVNNKIEPYKILFPLGALAAIVGVGLWYAFGQKLIHFYPRAAHAHIMLFAFLWNFVAGFLMTAVPKMTATQSASRLEISVAAAFFPGQLILNLMSLSYWATALYFMQLLFLLFFGVRRLWVYGRIPFPSFAFLPAAFLQAFIGLFIYAYYGQVARETMLLLCGEAFIMNLILGLGSRLIPFISRLPLATSPIENTKKDIWLIPLVVLILLNAGYFLQVANFQWLAFFIKAVAILIAAAKLLRLFSTPTQWTSSGVGLKFGIAALILGHIISFPGQAQMIAAKHLIYIGGFSLITLLVATRVMLAHGTGDTSYEISSPRILTISFSIIAAAFMRILAGSQLTGTSLIVAILFFGLAIGFWTHKFFKVSFKF